LPKITIKDELFPLIIWVKKIPSRAIKEEGERLMDAF